MRLNPYIVEKPPEFYNTKMYNFSEKSEIPNSYLKTGYRYSLEVPLLDEIIEGRDVSSETEVEPGSYLNFFVNRVVEDVADVFSNLNYIEGITDRDYTEELLNLDSKDSSLSPIRDILFELMSEHPRLYMIIKSQLFADYGRGNIRFEQAFITKFNYADGEQTKYIIRRLLDNVFTDSDSEQYANGTYFTTTAVNAKRARQVDEEEDETRMRDIVEDTPSEIIRPVKRARRRLTPEPATVLVQSAPRIDKYANQADREELRRLYDHLCFYLEPTHDFAKGDRSKDKEEAKSKEMSKDDIQFFKAGSGKYVKDDFYLNKLKEIMQPGREPFVIDGNQIDFGNPDELDSLLKIIEILGMGSRSKTIRFGIPVVKVTEKTRETIAIYEDKPLKVPELIGMLTNYFKGKRIFRDAKGTVIVGHLEDTNKDIADLKGYSYFTEKLFDGAGPNKLDVSDVVKVDYSNQILNTPAKYDDAVRRVFEERIIKTVPDMFTPGLEVEKGVARKFIVNINQTEREFGPTVKDYSTIMKYFMNQNLEFYVWSMLNLKRAGDHGQVERAKIDNGVFESLDHLAVGYAIMADVPAIFTYSNKKKGVIGEFIMTGVDLYVRTAIDYIRQLLDSNGELCKLFVDFGDVRLFMETKITEYVTYADLSIDSPEISGVKQEIIQLMDLSSVVLQLNQYYKEKIEFFKSILKPTINQFKTILNNVTGRSRTKPTSPLKTMLEIIMTAKNFSKYMSSVKTFISICSKIRVSAELIGFRDAALEVINRCLITIMNIDSNFSIQEFNDYMKEEISQILLFNLKRKDKKLTREEEKDWKNSVLTSLSLDTWFKEETIKSILRPFGELLDLVSSM